MAGNSDRTQRTMRWLLIGLLGLGLVWAAPTADASPSSTPGTGHRAELSHAIVVAHAVSVVAPSTTTLTVHHARSADVAFTGVAAWSPGTRRSEMQQPDGATAVAVDGGSAAPRAPPVEGSA